MKILNSTTLFSVLFLFTSVFAGEKGGADSSGGGGGVQVGPAIYLLDLYEANLHLEPYFEHNAGDLELEADLNQARLPEGTPIRHIARKLQDFEVIDPYLASALLEAIKALTWRTMTTPIEDTDDFGQSREKTAVVQIANRQGSVVQLQKQFWDLMNAENRTALIIHEALAALQPIAAHGNQGPLRRLVAWLFDQSFFERTLNHAEEALAGFPSFFEVKKMYPAILQRNFTRIHPVDQAGELKLEARSRFMLAPHVEFVWSDRRMMVEKLFSTPKEERTSAYVIPNLFDLPFMQYCDLPRDVLQLERVNVFYYRMQVTPTSYESDGRSYPMLKWSLKPQMSVSFGFLLNSSRTKANCGPNERARFNLLREWSRNIRSDGPVIE